MIYISSYWHMPWVCRKDRTETIPKKECSQPPLKWSSSPLIHNLTVIAESKMHVKVSSGKGCHTMYSIKEKNATNQRIRENSGEMAVK